MAALGTIEVCGYSTALLVANKLYQFVDVKVVGMNYNKPAVADLDRIPLQAQVQFMGDVDQVKQGLVIGREEARKYNDDSEIITHLIPNPYLKINEMKI